MERVEFTEEKHIFEGDCEFKSNLAANPNCGFNSIYVYCDSAEAITVGDTKAPILRVVGGSGSFGDMIHRLYTTPQYVSIGKKEMRAVEIDIRDNTGNPVAI